MTTKTELTVHEEILELLDQIDMAVSKIREKVQINPPEEAARVFNPEHP